MTDTTDLYFNKYNYLEHCKSTVDIEKLEIQYVHLIKHGL